MSGGSGLAAIGSAGHVLRPLRAELSFCGEHQFLQRGVRRGGIESTGDECEAEAGDFGCESCRWCGGRQSLRSEAVSAVEDGEEEAAKGAVRRSILCQGLGLSSQHFRGFQSPVASGCQSQQSIVVGGIPEQSVDGLQAPVDGIFRGQPVAQKVGGGFPEAAFAELGIEGEWEAVEVLPVGHGISGGIMEALGEFGECFRRIGGGFRGVGELGHQEQIEQSRSEHNLVSGREQCLEDAAAIEQDAAVGIQSGEEAILEQYLEGAVDRSESCVIREADFGAGISSGINDAAFGQLKKSASV